MVITIVKQFMGFGFNTIRSLVGRKEPEFDLRPTTPTPEIEAQIRGALGRHPAGRAMIEMSAEDYARKRDEIIALRKAQGYVTADPYALSRMLREKNEPVA